MESGRFSLHTARPNGIDNCAFQLHENGVSSIKEDTVSELRPSAAPNLYEPNHGHQRRKKSLVQLTREALPRLENYRNSRRAAKRPSIGELHGGEDNHGVKVCNTQFCVKAVQAGIYQLRLLHFVTPIGANSIIYGKIILA